MNVAVICALTLFGTIALEPRHRSSGDTTMSDADLYQQICFGDPLGSMTFDQAVNQDPRRIEGLVLQRGIQPLALVLTKAQHPNLDTDAIRSAMAMAYLQRNQGMALSGHGVISTVKLVEMNRLAWRMNATIFRNLWDGTTVESEAFRTGVRANQADIRRALKECWVVCEAARLGANAPEDKNAWAEMKQIIENMETMISVCLATTPGAGSTEVIDDETFGGLGSVLGGVDREDLFGGLSFQTNVERVESGRSSYGAEHEEYIVSGHRAPSVAKGQYRRMGGRVF